MAVDNQGGRASTIAKSPSFSSEQLPKHAKPLPTGTLVDGEIVAMDSVGPVSFDTLQRRRSEASCIRCHAFDFPIRRGRSVLHERLLKRREALSDRLRPIRKNHQ